ncbi:MAG: GTP cyclohydrolase I FolE [Actinomycetales bacterium]|nr:GTP cyclohydrolase I FolE [Actinomycetales bacterium]
MSVDIPRARAAVAELLRAVGEDPERPALASTPQRVADAWAELFAGVGADAGAPLRDDIPAGEAAGDLVAVRDLAVRSICEHHLLPFHGRAHVVYRPAGRIVGFGRLAAALEVLAARPQLQEGLGTEFAELVERELGARGVLVVLDVRQECLAARGERQASASTVTVAARGELARPEERDAALALLALGAGEAVAP